MQGRTEFLYATYASVRWSSKYICELSSRYFDLFRSPVPLRRDTAQRHSMEMQLQENTKLQLKRDILLVCHTGVYVRHLGESVFHIGESAFY